MDLWLLPEPRGNGVCSMRRPFPGSSIALLHSRVRMKEGGATEIWLPHLLSFFSDIAPSTREPLASLSFSKVTVRVSCSLYFHSLPTLILTLSFVHSLLAAFRLSASFPFATLLYPLTRPPHCSARHEDLPICCATGRRSLCSC